MTPTPEHEQPLYAPSTGVLNRWRRLGRLAAKELREILRDRRTIITLVLMPVLVYPLLSIAFQQFFLSRAGDFQQPVYTIGVKGDQQYAEMTNFFARYAPSQDLEAEGSKPPQPDKPKFKYFQAPDLRAAIHNGQIDLGLDFEIESPGGIGPEHALAARCELIYDSTSANGYEAAQIIRKAVDIANKEFLKQRLEQLGVDQRAVPVQTQIEELETDAATAAVSLTSVIPLILILMTITGAVYPAIDLTAGERERGTLEILIAAPIPRMGLLIAKYIAVMTVAMLTASVNLAMMAVTISVSGLGEKLLGGNGLTPMMMIQVFCLLVLFAMFFSAVLLALTSFARSFKEAQAYLIPLMLLSLAPGVMSLMPGLELTGTLAVMPLINIVLLGRDLMQSNVELTSLVAVVVSTSIYSLVAIAIAGKIFGAEGVLYSTQGSWSDFLRRPDESTGTPTLTNAMFCLACLFPAYFIISSLTARAEGLPVATRVLLSAGATGFLFGLFPLAAAYLGRVRLIAGFSLWRPQLVTIVGGMLLGLSLWPFAHEFTLMTNTFQLDDRFQETAKRIIEQVQAIPPVLLVLAYAVIPATFEEFCFRGYLYNAIRPRTTAVQTILATAIIFGLFHFVTQGALSMERLANSTMLGIILGWVRYKTDSIWPGIVMHTCHNGFLLIMAHYARQLEARFPQFQDRQHLPASWLIGAGVVAIIGFALVQLFASPPPRESETVALETS